MANSLLLLTRPRADSESVASALGDRTDVEFLVAPVLEIRGTGTPVSVDGYRTLVITSRHAASAIPSGSGLPVWCVGESTAAVLRDAGHDVAGVAPHAAALAVRLCEGGAVGPCLYLRGSHVTTDLAKRLSDGGLPSDEIMVYRQEEALWTPEVPALLAEASKVIVPLYSARSAELVSRRWPEDAPAPIIIGLSEAVLASWTKVAARRMAAAEAGGDAMLTAIVSAIDSG